MNLLTEHPAKFQTTDSPVGSALGFAFKVKVAPGPAVRRWDSNETLPTVAVSREAEPSTPDGTRAVLFATTTTCSVMTCSLAAED